MGWEKANAHGADYFRGAPSDLKAVTIVAQALDNQWAPNQLLSSILQSRQALKHFTDQRDLFVRREFLRAVLNAENVVANRAFLFNNPSIADFYLKAGGEADAFRQLLEARVILPFLFAEKAPHEQISLQNAFDRDRRAFEKWQEVCRECKPSCVRLSWPNANGEDAENHALISSHLARPFHDYGVSAKSGVADLYARHLGIGASHLAAFRERLNAASRWFFNAPEADDGSPIFRQRNDFYCEFVVRKDSPVHEGWYDPDKPFSVELKRLIDLKYNTNLADAIGRFALTPVDSLPRLALQENRISLQSAKGAVDAEALTHLLRAIMADLVQRQLDIPFLDSVQLQDVVAIRGTSAWQEYIDNFGRLLDTTGTWNSSGLPFAAVNTRLQEVFENYSRLTQILADTVRGRHEGQVRKGFEITYGIALSVMGQVIALVSPKGRIVFTALAELVRPHLPVERPAQVVCKLFFKDPSRSDILELEADMLECRLPHARAEFVKLLDDLHRAGFRSDPRTSLGDEEAKINIGRPEEE